jgi:hypothetical protein
MQKIQKIRSVKMPFWLEVRVPVTKAEAKSILGDPCASYEEGCAVCDGWKSYNDKGWIPVLLDRDELIKQESEPVTFKENRA